MLNGTSDENDCEVEDDRKILKLLQSKDGRRRTSHRTLTELEWGKIVKEAKNNSTP